MSTTHCSVLNPLQDWVTSNMTAIKLNASQSVTHTTSTFSELDVITLLLQIIGVLLLLLSLAVFIKNGLLQKKEHAYQVCLLASSSMLLLFDWSVLTSDYVRCDVFSLTFLLFGSANTLSSLAIAWDRFRRMSLLFSTSQRKAQYIAGVILIWILSLSTIALPLYGLIHADHHGRQHTSDNALCFFKNGLLHSTFGPSLYFTIVSSVIPTFGMLACYIGVFRSVKKARISRWINQASAAANRKAVIIQTNGRKANIVALPSSIHRPAPRVPSNRFMLSRQSRCERRTSSQERSILLKGIFSVCLVILWFPFTGLWLVTSIAGFKTTCINHFQLLIFLAKLSSILRIAHYIILNPKYKHFYMKLVCSRPCKNRVGVVNSDRLNSQIESNTDIRTSRGDRVWSVKERLESLQCAGTLQTIKETSTLRKQHGQINNDHDGGTNNDQHGETCVSD